MGCPGSPLPLLTTSLFCSSFSLGCFFLLTALHIYANYRAVQALVIETLNEGRLWLVLKHFLQSGEVLDPTSANQMEPLWTGDPASGFKSCVSPPVPLPGGFLTPTSHRFLAISVSLPGGPPTSLDLQVSTPCLLLITTSAHCPHMCVIPLTHWPPCQATPLL